MLKMAGGGPTSQEETNLQESSSSRPTSIARAGDVADQVFKVLNVLGRTHPFHVLRVAELRDWIEGGRTTTGSCRR